MPRRARFDVFMCYNTADRDPVKAIDRKLKESGIVTWLDIEQLRPGLPWQRALDRQIGTIRSAAVFLGNNGPGRWQDFELESLLREFVTRKCPVIPVILPGTVATPSHPRILKAMTWVDFRLETPAPLDQLVWGITGQNLSTPAFTSDSERRATRLLQGVSGLHVRAKRY